MTALVWDQAGSRFYEAGIDHGVYYPTYGDGVAWNGLVSVRESTDGGETTSYYIDSIKHLDVVSNEDFKATLTAFSAPRELIEGDGVRVLATGFRALHQPRLSFGLSYRTQLGSDASGTDYGYKIHLVYNATASAVEKTYATLSDQNSMQSFDWNITAVPVVGTGFKPTSHFEIYSVDLSSAALTIIENILYGTTDTPPRLPSISEIIEIIGNNYDLITEPILEPL